MLLTLHLGVKLKKRTYAAVIKQEWEVMRVFSHEFLQGTFQASDEQALLLEKHY